MAERITVSAKTLDEAITKALIELRTTSDHLQYEVIQRETAGLLGLFGKPCIIQAHVRSKEEEEALQQEAAAKAKEEKRRAQEAEAAALRKAKEKEAFQRAEGGEKSTVRPDAEKETARSAAGVKLEKREFTRREEGRREPAALREETPGGEKETGRAGKVNEEAVKKAAKNFLDQVFSAMGMEVAVESSYDPSERELQIFLTGDAMGILIGKRGQTLDSLQYLVSLVVNKETEGYLRVKLDTENYRERRRETLETLAKNISYKVKRTKHPVSLEPMNPYERRIIHAALQNDRYVVTRSEGEDPYRHVVISLKREVYSGGRRDRYPSKKEKNYRPDTEKRMMREKERPAEAEASSDSIQE